MHFPRPLNLFPAPQGRALAVLLLIVVPALLTGCTSIYVARPGAIGASTVRIPPDERPAVWQRAIGVFLDQGYVPQILNEKACYISAKRREDIADDAFAGTTATLFVTPEGVVRMEVSGAGVFHSEAQFVAAIRERQQTLLNLVLGRPVPSN